MSGWRKSKTIVLAAISLTLLAAGCTTADEDACEGSKESTAAAYLDTQTAYLAASILVESPGASVYNEVADAGNALLHEVGVDDAQFIEAACHGKVEETAACTALS